MERFASLLILFFSFHLGYSQNCSEFISNGDEYYAQFDFESALRQYLECQRLDFRNFDANYKSGLCLYQLQRYADARLYLKKSKEIDSTNALNIYYLAKCLRELGDFSGQLELMKELRALEPDNIFFQTEYADDLARYGQKDLAILEYLDMLGKSKNDVTTMTKLAELYMDFQEYSIADSLAKLAYRNESGRSIRLLRVKTEAAYKLKNNDEVVKTVNELLARGDSSTHYLKLQASAYHHLEEYEKSVEIGESIIERIVPKIDEYLHYLVASSLEKLELRDSSISHYYMAIKAGTSGNLGLYYERIAEMLEEENQILGAIQTYQDQLFFIEKPETYYKLAVLSDQYYADKTIAKRYFELFLKKAPEEMDEFVKYANNRIVALKEEIHQRK